MFEKVNPAHPDKVADRIAGALVDYAYKQEENPRIAVEVLIGHGECHVIAETSVHIPQHEIEAVVKRISQDNKIAISYKEVEQDKHLALNQFKGLRCGDNGIFKGCPVTDEQGELTTLAQTVYEMFPTDGKYIISDPSGEEIIICQSNAEKESIDAALRSYNNLIINPLGDWTGGPNVDSGATNRKLGSDMGDGVTGGGLHGKDLSKADVSVNIYCHQLAQILEKPVTAYCAIGDNEVTINETLVPYSQIVASAREYIDRIGGFEKFAEWGLIR